MKFSFKGNPIKELVYTLVVSFISGLFAYLLLHLITELSILYFSYDLNIEAILQLKGIHFLSSPGQSDWTKDATVTVFMVKPILNLLMAIATMISYTLIKNKSQSFSFFLIWIIIFGLNNIFGTLAENGILKTGIYNVLKVMNAGKAALVILIGLSIYFLYISGIGTGKIILLTLSERYKQNHQISVSYLIVAYLIPWILIFLFTFYFSDFNLKLTYLFSGILLFSTLRAKIPDKVAIKTESLPDFFRVDLISVIFFALGILIMLQMLAKNIQIK